MNRPAPQVTASDSDELLNPMAPIIATEPVNVDVLVIGGGPGGTTVATLLAQQGHGVALMEKAEHPRFHIGESLLPNNLPILERLGVLDQVRAMGVEKSAAEFICELPGEAPAEPQVFRFDRALGDTPNCAYQVTRSEFDELLFNNARGAGVDARDRHQVEDVQVTATGDYRVRVRDHEDTEHWLNARYVVDASGRDGFFARRLQWREKSSRHASAALFGHFSGVPRQADDNAGNISIYWFTHGWIWMIPLRDGCMSVGAVCWPDYLKSRTTDNETFLRETLALSPAAHTRMQHAVPLGAIRATGNYSYRANKLSGDGFLLVGDAYAFVDPVFSSGVYLAMSSAEQGAAVVSAWLAGDQRLYRRRVRRLQRDVDRRIDSFSWFIYRFTTPAMRDLFRNPRNDWQVEQAVISMLAGDGGGSSQIRWRIRLFKLIYHGYRLKRLGQTFAAWRRRRRNLAIRFEDEQIQV